MFKNINIIELLEKERLVFEEESEQLVDEALEILNETYIEDLIISEHFTGANSDHPTAEYVDLVHLDSNLIYSSEVIENICTKYRLRFLDSELFGRRNTL